MNIEQKKMHSLGDNFHFISLIFDYYRCLNLFERGFSLALRDFVARYFGVPLSIQSVTGLIELIINCPWNNCVIFDFFLIYKFPNCSYNNKKVKFIHLRMSQSNRGVEEEKAGGEYRKHPANQSFVFRESLRGSRKLLSLENHKNNEKKESLGYKNGALASDTIVETGYANNAYVASDTFCDNIDVGESEPIRKCKN